MGKNLTTGSVFKNIVLFSLPYLLSYFLRTLWYAVAIATVAGSLFSVLICVIAFAIIMHKDKSAAEV